MDQTILDTLDNKIVRLLTENGRMPIGEMAKRLTVTARLRRSGEWRWSPYRERLRRLP